MVPVIEMDLGATGWGSTNQLSITPQSSEDVVWEDVQSYERIDVEAAFPGIPKLKVPVYLDPAYPNEGFVTWFDYQKALGL